MIRTKQKKVFALPYMRKIKHARMYLAGDKSIRVMLDNYYQKKNPLTATAFYNNIVKLQTIELINNED